MENVKHGNYYGELRVPVLGISFEQLVLILYPSFLIPAAYFWYTYLQKTRRAANNPPGCRKLELKGPSHMTDQYDSAYDTGTSDQSEWKVKAIHIHPIKSCAAVELDEAEIDSVGMIWDRKFAFAELLPQTTGPNSKDPNATPKWTFRTQRTPGLEKLALVTPEVWVPINPSSSSTSSSSLRISQTGALIVRYPNIPTGPLAFLDRLAMKYNLVPSQSSFQVPLLPSKDHTYPSENVTIWNDSPKWLNMQSHVPADFVQFIGSKHPLALFRMDPNSTSQREVYRNAPRKEELGYQPKVGFADAYPLHILSLSSVHDVGKRIKESIPNFSAMRFRSNILIQGPKPYDEDDWKRIRLISPSSSPSSAATGSNSNEFYCVCHTVRCRLPNVDPDTSERHPVEPDKTLKSFRCIDDGDPKNACLGLQALAAGVGGGGGGETGSGKEKTITVRVGDKVEVLERGEHLYIKQGS